MNVLAWWNDTANVAELLEWLDEREGIDLTIACDILRKPYNWNAEWQEMRAEKDGPELARIAHVDDGLDALLEASVAVARGARGRR